MVGAGLACIASYAPITIPGQVVLGMVAGFCFVYPALKADQLEALIKK